jgi:probable F420-dependent oxidoreductase
MLASVDPGPIGILIGQRLTSLQLRRYARHIEDLGFGACWFGEGLGREAFTQASILLGATRRIVVGTSIANIYARDAVAMLNASRTLSEAWPDRFVLGMGVSHAPYVTARGHEYLGGVSLMRHYLSAMDAAPPYTAALPPSPPPTLLAALGPRMLALARRRAAGAISFLVDPHGAHEARSILGPERFHSVITPVAVAGDLAEARLIGGPILRQHLAMPNYHANLHRLGWTDMDLSGDGADLLFNAVIQWGEPPAIADRIRSFHRVGVDHVAMNICTISASEPPLVELELLAQQLVG